MPKTNSSKSVKIVGGVLILVCILVFLWGYHIRHTNYDTYQTDTTSQTAVSTMTADQSAHHKLTVLVTYKTGCRDCEKVKPKLLPAVRHAIRAKHVNVMLVNAALPAMANFLQQWSITHTPTVSVIFNGSTLYQYTGDNTTVLTRLVAGKDFAGKSIDLSKKAHYGYYRDDFDHTHSTTPITHQADSNSTLN